MKVLLCLNGEKDANKFTIDRNSILLKKALKSQNIEYTYDYKSEYDIVHVFSINQLKTYYSYVSKKNRRPIVFSAFNDFNDFKVESDEQGELSLNANKLFKQVEGISTIIVNWPSNEMILKFYNCPYNIELVSLGAEDYTKKEYLDIERNSFRRYYSITKEKTIVFSYGEYDYDKGLDTLEAVSRILPDYEFFFFGGKNGPLSNSKHYNRRNNNFNLHYENNIHRELYHSLLMNASCLFIPNKFHIDPVIVIEAMKQGVPIIANKNPFLYDLLIKNKTCFIEDDIENIFKRLKNIEKENYSKQAQEFIKPYTIEKYGIQIKEVYSKILNK